MAAGGLRDCRLIALVVAMATASCTSQAPVGLSLGEPGAAKKADKVLVAAPLVNGDATPARDVDITGRLVGPTGVVAQSLKHVRISIIIPHDRGIAQLVFTEPGTAEGRDYRLEVRGSYRLGNAKRTFVHRAVVILPPNAPGAASLKAIRLSSHKVRGAPYRASQVVTAEIGKGVNEAGPPTPEGLSSWRPRPTSRATKPRAAIATNASWEGKTILPFNAISASSRTAASMFHPTAAGDLVFVRNTPFGAIQGTPNDPSVASGGGERSDLNVVFATGNTYASYSVDGGVTFTQLEPTEMFDNTADGGLCCDQVVHYSREVNRFFWLMLFRTGESGTNRMRLATASPEALVSSDGTAWSYWDITAFDIGSKVLDYPDLSVGDHYLYFSVDGVKPGEYGLIVGRISLRELFNEGAITIEYTAAKDGKPAYGNHIMQNPGDAIFWHGPVTTDSLRIYSIEEGSHQYQWRDVDIQKYPAGDFSTSSPDGSNWLSSFFSGGPNGVRLRVGASDELIFQWTAGRGEGFAQPHIQVVRLDRNSYEVLGQTQIWHPDLSFGYASFALANFEVGMAIAWGGGGIAYGTSGVGFLGDYELYPVCDSSANASRYGDYLTIRTASPDGGLFSAAVYCTTQGPRFDPRYVLFGRSAAVNRPPVL